MSPWLDQTQTRFSEHNARIEPATRALLERIVADRNWHLRLLNTLSMLEHLGSHKIMATQHAAGIDQATLKHVAEEAHHAYFMKRQAEKAAGRSLSYTPGELIAPHTARMYFQRLECTVKRALAGSVSGTACYLYMSMIVEFRALWFYRLYDRVLKAAGYPLSLKRVLGEEEHHLADMAQRLTIEDPQLDARAKAFLAVESRLYQRLLDALTAAVEAAPPAPGLEYA